MTNVTVNTFTHSVVYVTDNVLKSLKDIIQASGLDPTWITDNWKFLSDGFNTWMGSKHLEKVELEIYDPSTDKLIIRWDIDICYGWSSGDDGSFWVDTDQLKYAIKKAGIVPSEARYTLNVRNKPDRPEVPGWTTASSRSIEGMVRQSLGSTVEHSGLGASTSYLRRK